MSQYIYTDMAPDLHIKINLSFLIARQTKQQQIKLMDGVTVCCLSSKDTGSSLIETTQTNKNSTTGCFLYVLPKSNGVTTSVCVQMYELNCSTSCGDNKEMAAGGSFVFFQLE